MISAKAYIEKVQSRRLIAGVVGLGYVGLPLAVEKAKAGFCTIGFDVQPRKVELVNQGVNYIGDVAGQDLARLVAQRRLAATNDFSFVSRADFIAICVPTPLDAHQQPDLSFVRASAQAVGERLRPGTAVVLESTTWPGTTEELIRPILEERSGLVCGKDFFLGFSPERVDPGNLRYKTKNTPKVVGAIGEEALEAISAMYEAILSSPVYRVSSPRVAEMEKLLENTYRNVNIALANEMALICHEMGVSIWEVIEAAKTKPYGFQPFYPGPGLGGHCIPLDPSYLTWKAREFGCDTRLIQTAGEVNAAMPGYTLRRCAALLNRAGKPLRGARVLVLGVAYKADIDDCRESPALKIFRELERSGASFSYYDPYVPRLRYGGGELESLPALDLESLDQWDLILIVTAHSCLDYGAVARRAPLVFDCRGIMAPYAPRKNLDIL